LEVIIRQAAEEDPRIKAMSADEIKLLGRMLYPIIYLDQANSEDENLTILDYISSEFCMQPENCAEISANKDYLNTLLNQLDSDDRAFMILKYGLIDGKERDKRAMTQYYKGVSETEIQKRYESILLKLKELGTREATNLDD